MAIIITYPDYEFVQQDAMKEISSISYEVFNLDMFIYFQEVILIAGASGCNKCASYRKQGVVGYSWRGTNRDLTLYREPNLAQLN